MELNHARPVSNNSSFYENNVKQLNVDDLTQYPQTSVSNMENKATGTTVFHLLNTEQKW